MLNSTRRWPVMTLRRAAAVLAGLFALGLLAGLAVDQLRTPVWEASTDVQVGAWSAEWLLVAGQPTEPSSADQADASTLAVSEPVLTRAAQELGGGTDWITLGEDVEAAPIPSSHLVRITATGPDEPTATARADAVGAALAALRNAQLDEAAETLASTPAGRNNVSIQLRSQLLVDTERPLEVFRSVEPEQVAPGFTLPFSAGVVGLGVGALLVLALVTLRPTIATARDAQRAVGLPGLDFDPGRGGVEAAEQLARLLSRLDDDGRRGGLLVVPLTPDVEKEAAAVTDWAQQRGYGTTAAQLLPEPTTAVVRTRPKAGTTLAMVLVAPVGANREQLRDAVRLLRPWRGVDAVVVTP